jgi:hypothetical protein
MNEPIHELEWDSGYLRHVLVVAPHGLTPEIAAAVKDGAPWLLEETRPGRSGSHMMIGPDQSGRFWNRCTGRQRQRSVAADYGLAEHQRRDSALSRQVTYDHQSC